MKHTLLCLNNEKEYLPETLIKKRTMIYFVSIYLQYIISFRLEFFIFEIIEVLFSFLNDQNFKVKHKIELHNVIEDF